MENRPKKKKMSLTQFFLIYILILAAILFGVVACNAAFRSNDTLKEEKPQLQSSSQDENNNSQGSENKKEEDKKEPVTDPNAPLSGLTVVIDAGHQETPPEGKESYMPWNEAMVKAKNTHGTKGTVTNEPEYVINLEIALKIRDTLEAQGAKVVMTRDNNGTSLSNQDRARIANNSSADIAISIHCNGSDNPDTSGIETYSRGDGDDTAEYKVRSSKELKLSEALLEAVCKSTGGKKRASHTSDNYTGINYSKIPFIILECGFMSNPDEDKNLADSAYQQKIADGICKFLKDNKKDILE